MESARGHRRFLSGGAHDKWTEVRILTNRRWARGGGPTDTASAPERHDYRHAMARVLGDDEDALAAALRLPFAKRDVFYQVRALNLRAQLTCAGRESRRGGDGYDWNGLQRGSTEFACIQYTIAGCGNLRWRGSTYQLLPGTAMLICVPHDHRYWLPSGGSWDFIWVCLSGREVLEAFSAVHARQGPVIQVDRSSHVLAATVRAAQEVLTTTGPGAYLGSALAYELAMSLEELAASPSVVHGHPGVQAAERFCQEHLEREVTVQELAVIAGLSRHHFTRRFTLVFGKPPKEYHTQLRIHYAAQLLRAKHSVKEVTSLCGFSDTAYFCRVFRRCVGISPGAFRKTGMFVGGQEEPTSLTPT